MNITWTIFFSFALLTAAACVIAGTYLRERWSKASGVSMVALGGLLAVAALGGGLANSRLVDISDSLFMLLALSVFALLGGAAGLTISLAKRDAAAVSVAALILLIGGTLVGINAAVIPEENRVREIASNCEKAGIEENICDVFAENYSNTKVAKTVFRTPGAKEEARLMLTGAPISSHECEAQIFGENVPTWTLSDILIERYPGGRDVNHIIGNANYKIDNIEEWCEAAEKATDSNPIPISERRVGTNGKITECRIVEGPFTMCWDIEGERR